MPVMEVERRVERKSRENQQGADRTDARDRCARANGARLLAGGREPLVGGWEPLAGDALLDRLRFTGRARPRSDSDLVERLRAVIERGLGADDLAQVDGPRIVVTTGRLAHVLACHIHRRGPQSDTRQPTVALACGVLMDVLFRQLVTIGTIEDPIRDGLDALAIDGRHHALLGWIGQLAPSNRVMLDAEVQRQTLDLIDRWPKLDPRWLPRSRLALRVEMFGGAVELSTHVDLAIGRPSPNVSSVGFVDVRSGRRRPGHRDDRHFAVLVDTLRSPAPPFVVATYYTRTGELDVDPVSEDLLFAAARRTAEGLRRMYRPTAEELASLGPDRRCSACSLLDERDPCYVPEAESNR
jgi:hypothetical protein